MEPAVPMTSCGALTSDFEVVRSAARENEPDRYYAALLAPRDARGDLIALAAFVGEVFRIGRIVRDPHLAEIRLQWWREALAGDERTGNPVADVFREMFVRRRLSRGEIDDWFDAVAAGFSAEPPVDLDHVRANLIPLERVPFAIAAQICGAATIDQSAFDDAALAYGAARLGLDLPYVLARGCMPLPAGVGGVTNEGVPDFAPAMKNLATMSRAALARLNSRFSGLAEAQKSALLPVALVEPYLRALERPGHDSAHDLADVAPFKRLWCLLRARMTNGI